jgi:hypothetical protein
VLVHVVDWDAAPYEYTVRGMGRSENVIIVDENHNVYMHSASCRDQVCVRRGAYSSAFPIVCLPNRVVVREITVSGTSIDAVTR